MTERIPAVAIPVTAILEATATFPSFLMRNLSEPLVSNVIVSLDGKATLVLVSSKWNKDSAIPKPALTSSEVSDVEPVTFKFPPIVVIPEIATLPVSASTVTAAPTLIPPLAVGLSPFVYASSQEDAIKLRLHIKADAELGEQQAGYIAEFIEFFDENFDSLKTIVGEVVDKLLKEAIVKALESVKEDFPDLASALGVDESKKRKKGIRILLGNRR